MDTFNTFPGNMDKADKKAIASEIYGNRFHADQTLYEYLIEFLLIFVSDDNDKDNPKERMRFHNPNATGKLHYTVEPRIGLKRFIFFDKNKKNDAINIDRVAYQEIMSALKDKVEGCDDEEKTELLEAIQDLFHGYAVVLKKRSWCAQAMLPLCPEVVFCEAMPKSKARHALVWDLTQDEKERAKVDTEFDFNKHNFLARGGELYYLHLLQGLQGKEDKRGRLEYLLREQIETQGKKMSSMASFIQKTWEEHMGYEEPLKQQLHLSFIPESAYKNIASDSVDELISFMSCSMHPVQKIELLAKGVMIQIMRMLSVATTNYLGTERDCWIMDMGGVSNGIVKRIASNSFSEVRNTFTTAIGRNLKSDDGKEKIKIINKARKDSFDIFKQKGKELRCIIPTSGPFERFSMPEDGVRFLVLALIGPGQKMTFDMFLEKLYEKYRIVVGPAQYKKMQGDGDISLANSFEENGKAFQEFLKATGFLTELSDATSIVINPYEQMKGEG